MLNKQDGAKRNDEATVDSTSPCKTSFKREIDEPDYDALKDLKACQRVRRERQWLSCQALRTPAAKCLRCGIDLKE